MPQSAQHSDPEVMMREIVTQYETYGDIGENTRIWAAYNYAKKAHEGVSRKSGDPYISHPVAAAQELMVLQPDSTTLAATLLHDAVSH